MKIIFRDLGKGMIVGDAFEGLRLSCEVLRYHLGKWVVQFLLSISRVCLIVSLSMR